MMNCGIYCIKNLINNKVYIGKTNDLQSRWKNHLFVLRANTHSNKHLQTAFNKYGESNFEFIVLLSFNYFDNDELNQLEIQYIEQYKSYINTFGYNKTLGGDGRYSAREYIDIISKPKSFEVELEMAEYTKWIETNNGLTISPIVFRTPKRTNNTIKITKVL